MTLRVITVIPGSSNAWAGAACGEVDAPCHPGVLSSTDGGATWKRVSTEAIVSLSFPDANHGWAVSAISPVSGVARILSSTDGGRSWRMRANPCPSVGMAPVAVTFPGVDHGWIGCAGEGGAGTAGKVVFGTTDGGKTWIVRALVAPPGGPASIGKITFGGYLNGIAMRANGIGMVWMDRSGTFRTMDGGQTWIEAPPAAPEIGFVSSAWLLTDKTWYVVMFDGSDGMEKLERSDDGGATWEVVASAAPS